MCCFVFIHKIRVIKELHTVADLDISEHCYEKHGKNAAPLCSAVYFNMQNGKFLAKCGRTLQSAAEHYNMWPHFLPRFS